MIKVRIDKTLYNLPTHLNEISISKGVELEKLSETFEGKINLRFKKRIISSILNCDYQEIDKVQDQQIEFLYDNHIIFNKNLIIKLGNAFYLKGRLYKQIDFDTISVLNYTDIDVFLENKYNNISDIINILYKETKIRLTVPLFLIKILSYFKSNQIFNVIINSKNSKIKNPDKNNTDSFFNAIDFITAKSMILNYLNFKYELLRFYNMIENDHDLEETQEMKDTEDIENHIKKSVAENWGLFHILYSVSNDDLNQLDTWIKKPIKQLFTYMKYKNDLINEINQNQKNQNIQ